MRAQFIKFDNLRNIFTNLLKTSVDIYIYFEQILFKHCWLNTYNTIQIVYHLLTAQHAHDAQITMRVMWDNGLKFRRIRFSYWMHTKTLRKRSNIIKIVFMNPVPP